MRSIVLGIVVLAIASAVAIADGKRQVQYVGIHPVAKSEGGGFCYIEGPHVHIYAADKVQYRDHNGANYFVGDPVAYGYDGPKHAYKGHHPIHVNVVVGDDNDDVEYCYLDGSHYHYFAAPEGPEFKVAGDAYFYVGEPPQAYIEARPAYIGINAVYRPFVYARPVVTVEAPVGWVGARIGFGGPAVIVAHPGAAVVVPGGGVHVEAGIHVPMPSVHVDVGIGGPFIGGGVIVHERPVIIKEKKWKKRGR
jgi:hypothetical protein